MSGDEESDDSDEGNGESDGEDESATGDKG